jgi:copper chaperone CopZ
MPLVMSVFVFLVVNSFAGCSKADSATKNRTKAETTCVVTLTVTGMTCGQGCPPRVERALKKVDGVNAATASYETTSATVDCAKALCSDQGHATLIGALEVAGYGGSFKSSKPTAPVP